MTNANESIADLRLLSLDDVQREDYIRMHSRRFGEVKVDAASIARARRMRKFGRPRAIGLGDSIMRANYSVSVSSITYSGGIVTVNCSASHQLYPGGKCFVSRVTSDTRFNGVKTVLDTPSTTTLRFATSQALPATATGSNLSLLNLQRVQDSGFLPIANGLLHQRMDLMHCAAHAGARSAEILTRLDADVLQYEPDMVFIYAGINDIAGDIDLATIKANLIEMWERVYNAGALPIAFTIGPFDSNYSAFDTEVNRRVAGLELNRWMREYAEVEPYLVLIDANQILTDATDATGDFKSGYSSDSLHPALGSFELGNEIYTRFNSVLAPIPWGVTSTYDRWDTDNTLRQINPNALMTGTGGAEVGDGVAGAIADGYTITESGSGTPTYSKVARADGLGSDQRIATTSAALDDRITIAQTTSLHSRVTVGDKLSAELHIKGSNIVALSRCVFELNWVIDGTTYRSSGMNTSATLADLWHGNDFDMRLQIPPVVMWATPTSVNCTLEMRNSGVGSFQVDVGVWPIVKNGGLN